jgi:hypothetical protein
MGQSVCKGGLRFATAYIAVMPSGRMWGRSIAIRRVMFSVISDPFRTPTMEPASMSRQPFETIWEPDLRAWLTGDLLRKWRCRPGPGQCPLAYNACSQDLGTWICGRGILGPLNTKRAALFKSEQGNTLVLSDLGPVSVVDRCQSGSLLR